MRKLEKLYRFLVYALPGALFFSYHPVISLGGNETMNFELSLALVWLVLFDLVGVVMVFSRRKEVIQGLKGKWWLWILLPVYLTVSVFWSLNSLRGILTVGILWLVYFAGYILYSFRGLFTGVKFREKFWKAFFGSALVVCGWCVLQCILDLAGVSRDYTLMCAGCTYKMFGFPHPNGFAIEPQFMGNLLLAPAIVAVWAFLEANHNSTFRTRVAPARRHGRSALMLGRNLRTVLKVLLLVSFLATLFLTFSRGAIYAFLVAVVFLSGLVVARGKRKREAWKRVGKTWGVIVVAFLFTLNLQGVMAAVSPTNDTYFSGVAKVLNHLSLGVVDIRGGNDEKGSSEFSQALESEITGEEEINDEKSLVEKPVENSREEAVFDGYVEESTAARVRLTETAVEVWSQDFKTVLFGVGIGGAGQALYDNELSPAPKEIVQNEYASLLLETGLVGVSLFILTIWLGVRAVMKRGGAEDVPLILALMVGYGVSLLFFSGLPNALQIYLTPIAIYSIGLRKKLVS